LENLFKSLMQRVRPASRDEISFRSSRNRRLEGSWWGEPVQEADANTREHGADLIFQKDSRRLRIEVKGYPSDKYMHGAKQGQPKRTKPTTQARHWFAEAFFGLAKAMSKDQALDFALGLPKIEPFPKLWAEIKWVASKMNLGCYFVSENGEVKYESASNMMGGR